MKKLIVFFLSPLTLIAHCQMPCGIYHDNMVYDQIDQYVETMYKGITVLNENKFSTAKERNEFGRWVYEKEHESSDAAELILKYFLQQKIKPGEPDTIKRLTSAHKLLFLIVAIKQGVDLETIKEFNAEWERFKLMFHREGYECEMEKKEFKQLKELREVQSKTAREEDAKEHAHDHDHPHDNDHKH